MTDKVQKIRKEVVRIHNLLPVMDGDNISVNYADRICTTLEMYIDSLQEEPQVKESAEIQHVNDMCKENGSSLTQEPVSEDLEKACEQLAENARKHKAETSSPFFSQGDYKQGVIDGAKWQKEKDESTTEDLGEYINELSKQFPEVSFAKLSRIAVRVAKWQKERFEKNRLAHCDALTEEQAQIESDFVTKHLKENSRTPTFIDAIEYGIKMQEEQMMAKAVDGEVTYGKSLAIPSLGWVLDKEELNFGDKVKLIIIKQE